MVISYNFDNSKFNEKIVNDIYFNCHKKDEPKIFDAIKIYYGDNPFVFLDLQIDFSIIFKKNGKLHLVRDLFGNFPLYYLINNDNIYSSTKIGDLVNLKFYEKRINELEAKSYLNPSYDNSSYDENTLWEGIHSVIPGQILIFDQFQTKSYENYLKLEKFNFKNEPYITVFKENFLRQLKDKIGSNSSISCSLSGGLDSSSISCCLQYISENTINTIEFRDANETNPERKYAQDVVDKWHTNHTIIDTSILKEGNLLEFSKKICQLTSLPNNPFFVVYNLFEEINVLEKLNSHLFFSGHGGDDVMVVKNHFIDQIIENKEWVKLKNIFNKLILLFSKSGESKNNYILNYIKAIFISLVKKKEFKELIKFYYFSLKPKLKIISFFHFFPWLFYQLFKDKPININEFCLFDQENVKTNNNLYNLFAKDVKPDQMPYVKEIFRKYSIKNREQVFQVANNYGITYKYPFYNIDLMKIISTIPAEVNFGNGIGRNVIRQALSEILPVSVKNRVNKTEFSNLYLDLFVRLFEQRKIKLDKNHKVFEYIDSKKFLNSANYLVKARLNNSISNKYNIATTIFFLRIIYFSIWLDEFFPD